MKTFRRAILLVAIVLSLVSCSRRESNQMDVIHFLPGSREELQRLGFTQKPGQRAFYSKRIGDTDLFIFFLNDTQYLKAVQYSRTVFDSVKLYQFFKTLDPDFNDSSSILTVSLPGLGNTVHRVYRDDSSIAIYYSNSKLKMEWGRRR